MKVFNRLGILLPLILTLLCAFALTACSVDSKFVGTWQALQDDKLARLVIRPDGAVIIHWRRAKNSAVWKVNEQNQLAIYSQMPIKPEDKPLVTGKIINKRLITTGLLTSDTAESLSWLRLPPPQ